MGQKCVKSSRKIVAREENATCNWEALTTKLQNTTAIKQKAGVLVVLESIIIKNRNNDSNKWITFVEKLKKMEKYKYLMSSNQKIMNILINNIVESKHRVLSDDTEDLNLISFKKNKNYMDSNNYISEDSFENSFSYSSAENGYFIVPESKRYSFMVNGEEIKRFSNITRTGVELKSDVSIEDSQKATTYMIASSFAVPHSSKGVILNTDLNILTKMLDDCNIDIDSELLKTYVFTSHFQKRLERESTNYDILYRICNYIAISVREIEHDTDSSNGSTVDETPMSIFTRATATELNVKDAMEKFYMKLRNKHELSNTV